MRETIAPEGVLSYRKAPTHIIDGKCEKLPQGFQRIGKKKVIKLNFVELKRKERYNRGTIYIEKICL
ncbi:hypothetical protein RUMHYD_02431 [Blautia hydrogenotrophica DSM 10507]|uniref:Uncharacterized protein n=1 Tax=Blautia hydrogenotrophica (strain DSM 10507 / JCM 14656 / S5a33) TaxID=476272 RepID=C0CNI8_BLAHS|nr:hypothetical protein RUMHYD_02431 [Blautia hydrogenotrophica DSM 10507]